VEHRPVMMVLMSSDPQPIRAAPTPAETVVEFGADPEGPPPRRRRLSASEILAGLAADRRAVPLAAAVGGVALFASLMSEWQITLLNTDQFTGGPPGDGNRPLSAGVIDLGAIGGAYLVGLFLLAGATALVLYGPGPARRYARVLGLSTGGVLIGLLAALTASLGETSRVVFALFALEFDEEQMRLSYGRGIWCAFFGVAAVLLALYLAGRHEPGVVAVEQPEDAQEAEAPVVWSWRRPKDGDEDEGPPDAPFDLTVSSTKPFTSLSDDRDKPS